MRPLAAAAPLLLLPLLALVTVPGCARAERPRERPRGGGAGAGRRAPPAADSRRDLDFDCPEEFGYYPHPTDCTLYYVCVFGGALLESCTGGLMYSHELQTCDWPRNVGCDGATAAGGDELERLSERDPPPPPPPPRRKPAPLRAQPNPVVTSRGQPKFNRNEYEKQQQLYADVDDLPPVEEIESDRQQRVYRGQPSTIGQVQKDRDGYVAQAVSSGRNFNTNIIPASITQNGGKIGSFSFGSQVDDRRSATVTQAPQSYSDDKLLTDSQIDRRIDIETNDIDNTDYTNKVLLRKKRDVVAVVADKTDTSKPQNNTNSTEITSRHDEFMEFGDMEEVPGLDDENTHSLDDSERGKRQVGYYLKNGYKTLGKNWALAKPIKFIEVSQPHYSQNGQNVRYHQQYSNNNQYYDNNRRPHSLESNAYSVHNPFVYHTDTQQSYRPFKASLPDYTGTKNHHSPNIATQIITKSPPISALQYNENPFSSYSRDFYNNVPKHSHNNHFSLVTDHPNSQISYKDSSLLPSSVVTGKPVLTSPRTQNDHQNLNKGSQRPVEEDYESYEEGSEEESEEDDGHRFPKPPYEFSHPSHKYANIENPFANPNFDFDAYLSKLSNGQFTTQRSIQSSTLKPISRPVEITPSPQQMSAFKSSTLDYKGVSTPRPFTVTFVQNGAHKQELQQPVKHSTERYIQSQQQSYQNTPPNQYSGLNNHQHPSPTQQSAEIQFEATKPKIKPPNFKDDRQLPISYSFSRPIDISSKPSGKKQNGEQQKAVSVLQNPFILLKATASPVVYSSPKQQYVVSSDKVISLSPYGMSKPGYLVSTTKPSNGYSIYKHSTPNPLTTVADEQLQTLQKYWKNSTTGPISAQYVTIRPSTTPDLAKLKNLFAQAIASTTQSSVKNPFHPIGKDAISSTMRTPAKRRPIPKPSPEMNDYYYDDDEYYEPLVKPKYMPSTEVKPQRPPMAQNYKEYDDDSYEYSEEIQTLRPKPTPNLLNTFKPDTSPKTHNDVSVVTKTHSKDYNKNSDGKIPIPVLLNFASPPPTVLIRQQGGGLKMIDRHRNRTMYFRKPVHESGPNTNRPPKYLNQTTLRPYTVRHRLAKPTPVEPTASTDQTRGKGKHPNIVAQMLTTPRDSHNQETRFTKVKHDGRTNSLEPTESVVPVSYSPSPRPKMLYNGSQTYSSDQYDPYYAIYDEDGELYKDTDYVQQYNTASLRPAVQQTYRGTPPPAPAPAAPRRPVVDNYTPRPITSDDYDDALIQGQINNQNHYQSTVRQSTRGDGNELGYDHHPSSVKTTLYEATPISTTPPTTSTSTTLRTTSAPFTEAMTPHRYTSRSSTDENPIPKSETPSNINSSDESVASVPSTSSPVINFSSLAKPFEKTDNIGRFDQTASTTTEKLPSSRRPSVTNTNGHSLEVVGSELRNDKKKYVSLTTGFSIRRNANNSNNPYTLTVLTRPFEDYDKYRRKNAKKEIPKMDADRYYYDSSTESKEKLISSSESNQFDSSSENQMRRKDSHVEVTDEFDIPVYVRPTIRSRSKPNVKATSPPTTTTKYYLKSIIKRPAPFSTISKDDNDTDNNKDLAALIDTGLQNAQIVNNQEPIISTTSEVNITPKRKYNVKIENNWNEPTVSPFKSLDNIRNNDDQQEYKSQSTTTSTSTARPSSTTARENINIHKPILSRPAPSYYSYRLEDEFVPDQTTEVLSSTVKNVLKAFFNNFVSSPVPEPINRAPTSTSRPSLPPHTTQKIVNIGFQKKPVKYVDEKPPRKNFNHLQIITEPIKQYVAADDVPRNSYRENNSNQDFSTTTPTMTTMSTSSFAITSPATTPIVLDSSPYQMQASPSYQPKFSDFVRAPISDITTLPTLDITRKFQNIINVDSLLSRDNIHVKDQDELIKNEKTIDFAKLSEIDWNSETSDSKSEIASTTSTTKATTTTTLKIDPTKSTSKSASFPTRASRVNPAIKLAASNPGSGRRSYQSSSKCSTDNSLQANPKCNEIKYQRPSSTRGRGSAHYSTLSGNESPQQAPNRGTPPTRSRPTLKPSTAIVSKSTEFVDIYSYPPSRPAPVYPQPTPDKTAAKCRKDVCLLPDCYCGGKDIPGDMPVEQVPQIVLLTFDDSVNDLNKGLYMDLFEKGRVNPNGCPISATFYVSHEWTDYSQVQNLYAAGHEMASHTISHSFGEQFSQKKWNREVGGQREILSAYGGVKLEDVRGMRAPFLSIGGNKMFKMLYDSNFTYDSSMPVYENRPPSWPYTLDYKLFHDCMIPPCPTKSYPGVWEVPMVMWQDLNGGRCSMGDACANPPEAEGVYKMLLKNFDRHYTTNRAPFGLYYHAAWFTQPHHKEGFIMFLDFINQMQDVWIVTNWQALQWVRDPTPISRLNSFQPFQCNYQDRPKKCNNPKVCNLWHKSGVRYMRTCQPCPEVYPWTGKTGIRSSRIDNDNGE